MTFLWLLLLAGQNKAESHFFSKDHRHYSFTPTGPVEALNGQLITETALGAILQRQNGLVFRSLDRTETPLEEPAANEIYLPQSFPDVNAVTLFSRSNLYVKRTSGWQALPSLVSSDMLLPTGGVAGTIGQQLFMPQLVSIGNILVVYQPKTGEGYWADATKFTRFKIKKNRVLIPFGRFIAWVSLPDDGWLSLSQASDPSKTIKKIKVKNLDRHSLVVSKPDATWFICFDQGMFAALDAWKHQNIELQITLLQHDSLNSQHWNIDEMPLRFHMGTNASGSPKLVPEAGFETINPIGYPGICLLQEKSGILLDSAGPKPFQASTKFDRILFFQDRWFGVDSGGIHPLKP